MVINNTVVRQVHTVAVHFVFVFVFVFVVVVVVVLTANIKGTLHTKQETYSDNRCDIQEKYSHAGYNIGSRPVKRQVM